MKERILNYRSLQRAALVSILAGSACSTYQTSPGDWLNDHTPLSVVTPNNYQHLAEPDIVVHYRDDDLASVCGSGYVDGCAIRKDDVCDVYVGSRAGPWTIEHEKRHCRGWEHYEPDWPAWSTMTPRQRAAQMRYAQAWYPADGGH